MATSAAGAPIPPLPANDLLARSEERLSLALAAAGVIGVWDGDLIGDRVYGDATFASIYGVDPAEAARGAPRGTYFRRIHPDDAAVVRAAMDRALAGLEEFTSEHRIFRPDGTMRWVLTRGRMVRDAAGVATRFPGVSVDITERKLAEDRLVASEARFRAAVAAVQGVLWTNAAEGRMVGEQPAWAALTGQTFAEYQDFGWAAAVHPEDAAPTVTAWNAAVAARRPFVHEHRVRRHDGVWRRFSIRAVPISDDDGTLREWVGVHTDITEQRAAEQDLLELNERLEQRVGERTRERDRLWELSEDLLVVADYEGRLLRVSPSWTRLLGYDEATLLGNSYVTIFHPDDLVTLGVALDVMRSTERSFSLEVRVRASDGTWRWLAWKLAPEPGGARLSGIGRDITAAKAREADLAKAQEALRQSQKMEAVGQLTGGLAHDFNNLLTAISGSLELLDARIAQGRLGETVRPLAAARDAADRAAALIHRLLAFSRRQTLDPQPTDANRLVADMADLIQRTVGSQVVLSTALSADLWPTLCDSNQLESALLNLCINARDAMPDGGNLTITNSNIVVDERAARNVDLAQGDYVTVCVVDTGTGMTPEVMARAFDPFFTTKPIGQGTGLGLSMIYGFAKQSGGQARIRSQSGHGTTMELYLPRYRGQPDMPAASELPDLLPQAAGES